MTFDYIEPLEEIFDPSFTFFFYAITCKDLSIDAFYIGKTIDIKSRIACHKTNSKSSETKLYKFIRENGGIENFNIKIIHKCTCIEKTSIYIEYALIKQYKDQGFQMLNIQVVTSYPLQKYNKEKCGEHYAIKKECKCGWTGSKMNFSKHVKTSLKHHKFCIAEFEVDLLG